MNATCPLCGSESVSVETTTDNFPIPFASEQEISYPIHYCSDCEEDGDFDGTMDAFLNKALHRANAASAPSLIADLVADGVTMTYLEKSLRIPFKTTARWKRGKISHAALALLRIIRFSPELLELADEDFSEEAQAKYRYHQSCSFVFNHFESASQYLIKAGDNVKWGITGWNGTKEIPSPRIETKSVASVIETPETRNLAWEIVR